MTVLRHCADCGEPLSADEIAVDVREWDSLHAENQRLRTRAESLSRQLAGAVGALKFYAAYGGSTDGNADSGQRARDALKAMRP